MPQDPARKSRNKDATWSQVRDRIDRGETGDKVAVGDPAAAPLGTDSEAGGSSLASEHIARSAAAEQAGRPKNPPRRPTAAQSRWALLGFALTAVGGVCLIAAVALLLAP